MPTFKREKGGVFSRFRQAQSAHKSYHVMVLNRLIYALYNFGMKSKGSGALLTVAGLHRVNCTSKDTNCF